jgi:hypothetical protein
VNVKAAPQAARPKKNVLKNVDKNVLKNVLETKWAWVKNAWLNNAKLKKSVFKNVDKSLLINIGTKCVPQRIVRPNKSALINVENNMLTNFGKIIHQKLQLLETLT